MLLSIVVTSYKLKVRLFVKEMQQLDEILLTKSFINFIEKICEGIVGCDNISPPFFYLKQFKFKYGPDSEEIPNPNIRIINNFLTFYLDN